MRWLPLLHAANRSLPLPMADASAAALEELLVAGPAPACRQRAVRQLRADPPLTLWAAWHASREGIRPGDAAALANWLADRALALFCGPAGAEASTEVSSHSSEDYCRLVQQRLLLAEFSARLAAAEATHNASLPEQCRLLGLLWEPAAWFPPETPEANDLPGTWFSEATDAARLVGRAAESVAGRGEMMTGVDLNQCKRLAAAGAEAWLAPAAASTECLSLLAAKLARLAELETRFERLLERQKLEALADFAAGAGHEINNPLTVIAGRAQLLLHTEKDPERRRELALMNSQAMRVNEMIADMWLFARPPEPQRTATDLAALADRLIDEISPRAGEQDTALVRSGLPGPVWVEIDPVQIAVAAKAVCVNALEALTHGGRVEIAVLADEQAVSLRVRDDGPGIADDERTNLFNPFYSARQAGRGLGLGLSKSWRILSAHGGRIEVESQPGRGACFTLVLPQRCQPVGNQP